MRWSRPGLVALPMAGILVFRAHVAIRWYAVMHCLITGFGVCDLINPSCRDVNAQVAGA